MSKEMAEVVQNVRAMVVKGKGEIPAVKGEVGFTLYDTPECQGCPVRQESDDTICMNRNTLAINLLEASGYESGKCKDDPAKTCLIIRGHMSPAVPRRYNGIIY